MKLKGEYYCSFCNKKCVTFRSLRQHEIRCKLNPERINVIVPNFNSKGRTAWNKGLTKETNESIKNAAERASSRMLGKKQGPLSDEHKLKISKSRKRYLSQHPEKVPYLLNHSSKISYPEQYFIDLFLKEGINLQYHLQISKYQLDFYNQEKKLDVEIDGEQHYLDSRIAKIDKERDNYMTNLGWTVKRIRWSEYKKLSIKDKKCLIEELKSILQ